MKVLTKYYYHPYFLYSLQIIVLLVGGLFFSGGCPVEPADEEKIEKDAFEQYTGRWKLVYAEYPIDTPFVNIARIELKSDSTFYSNTAFFWYRTNDTLRYQSLYGRWNTSYTVRDNDEGPSGPSISLTVYSTTQYWGLWGGGTKDSTMEWRDNFNMQRMYSWKLY